jgi:hypothetical protein
MKIFTYFLTSLCLILFTVGEVSAGNYVKAALYNLAEDLKIGNLTKMEVISLNSGVSAMMSITPELFDGMAADNVTPSMFMSQCEMPLSGAIDSSLAYLFSHAAETAVEAKSREIYWRLRFFGASNEPKYTIYMGTWYYNSTEVGVVVNSQRANVELKLEKWFENNIDYKRCLFRPSA